MRPMILVLSFLLLALPARGQEPTPDEIERLVASLGHEDYAVRSEATARLEALGATARAALETALGSSDPEVRLRARELLDGLARRVPYEPLVAEQRDRKLGRVTLALEAAPFDAFAKAIATRTGLTLKAPEPAPDSITVRAEAKPLHEVLRDLGWSIDPGSIRRERFGESGTVAGMSRPALEGFALVPVPGEPAGERVSVAGGEFVLVRRPWTEDGVRRGWVFEIDARPDFQGEFEWRVVSIAGATGETLTVETCPRHSPDLVYVPRPDLDRPVVRLAGISRWRADVAVRIDEPAAGRTKEIGGWLVGVAWPSLEVKPPRPTPPFVIESALSAEDVRWTARPGARASRAGDASSTRVGIGIAGGVGAPGGPPGWCGCPGGPRGAAEARTLGSSNDVRLGGRASAYAVEQLASIEFTFHLPVEDRFEVESDPVPIAEER